MRVALVHDWLNGMRGGEKVLEALVELFPDAPIYTLFHERGRLSSRIESRTIVTSWLDRLPGVYRYYRNLLPLFPAAIQFWSFDGYDLVLSSSHAVAKAINTGRATHICYCHTPMRYLWDAAADYQMSATRAAAFALIRPMMRRWDRRSADRVDHFIANSRFVQRRIELYYSRQSKVIHPPIETTYFTPAAKPAREDFYLTAGALTPYKRADLTVRAFSTMGKRLVVAGSGPELERLRGIAARNVEFRGWVSNEELRELYRTARAFVYMAREDFGIVAAEARSCGCPVVAYGAGGIAEIVDDGVHGVLFKNQNELELIQALKKFESMDWPPHQVRQGVEHFSSDSFKVSIRNFIEWHRAAPKRRPFPA